MGWKKGEIRRQEGCHGVLISFLKWRDGGNLKTVLPSSGVGYLDGLIGPNACGTRVIHHVHAYGHRRFCNHSKITMTQPHLSARRIVPALAISILLVANGGTASAARSFLLKSQHTFAKASNKKGSHMHDESKVPVIVRLALQYRGGESKWMRSLSGGEERMGRLDNGLLFVKPTPEA